MSMPSLDPLQLLPILIFALATILTAFWGKKLPWPERSVSTVGVLSFFLAFWAVTTANFAAAGVALIAAGISFGILTLAGIGKRDD